MKKRSISLRWWLMGLIPALVVINYVGVFLLVLLTSVFEPNMPPTERLWPQDEAALAQTFQTVESQYARWSDPAWRTETDRYLAAMGLQMRVTDSNGVSLYPPPAEAVAEGRVNKSPGGWSYRGAPLRTIAIYDQGRFVGQAEWTRMTTPGSPEQQEFVAWQNKVMPVGIGLLVLLTVWGAATLVTRAVFMPLRDMARAAERICAGELDVEVPVSRIREIDEFTSAFDKMRVGLKQALAQQAAMEEERRLFISSVAHDLRTPLTSVRGYLEGLRDGVASTPEKMERYVQVALEKTASLERLIESFFAYAKVEYLDQRPQMETIGLDQLLTAVVEAMQPQAAVKGIALRLDAGPDGCAVQGDRLMLTRVVDNLLDNALRHTPTGGQVEVGWRVGAGFVRFWVQDSGPGVPDEDLARIFMPTFRSDKARSSRTGGAGLGLAITRRLVEAHGGHIAVINQRGARFTVTLPVQREA
jgi:signal transduction histidine kinase